MKLVIVNEKGLHARASAKFSEVCDAFDAKVTVIFDDLTASGDSIMGLMMLGAARGSVLEVEATGPDADRALTAVKVLVDDYFGEGG